MHTFQPRGIFVHASAVIVYDPDRYYIVMNLCRATPILASSVGGSFLARAESVAS